MDLTQATLQEYALSKGMDINIKTMSQAEKTMLRYQYVMDRLGYVQGDFLATSTTWANQVRILMQQLGDVGKNIGNIIIGALKPFVQSLNAILARVREFTKNVLESLGTIFGWQVEVSGGGTDLGDLGDDSGELSDNLEDADKAAKAIKNTIMGFDELNVLNGANDSGDNASGAADNLSDGLDAMTIQLRRTEPIWKGYESEIDSLSELGQYFSDTLNNFLSGFDADEFSNKMTQFSSGLAQFFNGFNDPETSTKAGNVVAGVLNGLVDSVNAFIENFDTKRFTDSISGFVSGINNIDWESLQTAADNIGTAVGEIGNGLLSLNNTTTVGHGLGQQLQAVLQGVYSAVTTFDFASAGTNLAAGLNTMMSQIDTDMLFTGLVEGIGGIGETIGNVIANIDWLNVLTIAFSAVSGIIVGIFKGMFAIGGAVGKKIKEFLTGEGGLIPKIGSWFGKLKEEIPKKIGDMGSKIKEWAGKVKEKFRKFLIGEDGNGGVRGKVVEWFKNMPSKIFSAVGTMGTKIKEWADKLKEKFRKVLIGEDGNGGVRGKVVEWFRNLPGKIFAAIGTLGTKVKEWGEKVKAKFKKTLIGEDGNGGVRGKIIEWFRNLPEKMFNAIGSLGTNIREWGTKVKEKFRNTLIGEDGNGGVRGKIIEWFKNMPDKIFNAIGNMWSNVKQWAEDVKDNFKTKLVGSDGNGGIIGDIKEWFSDLPDKIFGGIGTLWDNITSWASDVKDNFEEKLLGSGGKTGIVQQIAAFFWELPGKIFSGIGNIASYVGEWITNVKNKFGDKILGRNGETSLLDDIVGFFSGIWTKMKDVGDNIMSGIWEGISNAKDWLKTKIDGVVDSVVGWWKNALGIQSPSKVFAEIGGYMMDGLQVGMEDGYGSVLDSSSAFATKLSNKWGSMTLTTPQLNTGNLASLSNMNLAATATVGMDIDSLQDAVITGVEIALSNQNERPINVNAVLKTENDEILARAVTRGQRSISYRTNTAAY